MQQLTYWHVRWVIPAAIVQAALEIGGGDVVKGLRKIAENGEPWMRSLALELLYDRKELNRVLEDLRDGIEPDPKLVDLIKGKVMD